MAKGFLNIHISFSSCLKLRTLKKIQSLQNIITKYASQRLLLNRTDTSFEYIFVRKKMDVIMLTGIFVHKVEFRLKEFGQNG